MSVPQEILIKLAMAFGEKNSEHHANFIRKIERWIDQIFDPNVTIEEKECLLHKIGLADNKIDVIPEVKLYKKKLSNEIKMQRKFIKYGQFQNLEESDSRCIHYVKEILRLISPRALDIGAASPFEEAKEGKKKHEHSVI